MTKVPMEKSYDRVVREIAYARNGACRATGDLFIPEQPRSAVPVLLIHGGGWNAASKEFFEFMLPIFALAGRPVFNINYRYLSQARWPACLEDALAAARFVLEGGLSHEGLPTPSRLLICGASAGGHLAMMTGLGLPGACVEGIVSMAGPSRLDWLAQYRDPLGMHNGFLPRFFGREVLPNGPEVAAASPALCVKGRREAPPALYCLHSTRDLLCPARYSEEAVRVWKEAGGEAMAHYFEGEGDFHGFWVNSDRESDILQPEVLIFFARVFNDLARRAALKAVLAVL